MHDAHNINHRYTQRKNAGTYEQTMRIICLLEKRHMPLKTDISPPVVTQKVT